MTVWVSNPKKSIKSLLESSVKIARYHVSIKKSVVFTVNDRWTPKLII